MISTFGCNNGLILAGARAYYAMARDGLFFRAAGELNAAKVPAWGLMLQGIWAACLVLPRTYNPATSTYGNLYGNLLDYVDLGGADLLHPDDRRHFPAARRRGPTPSGRTERSAIRSCRRSTSSARWRFWSCCSIYRTATTWPGLVIVLLGIPVFVAMRHRPSAA